jgi:hypothetical protein
MRYASALRRSATLGSERGGLVWKYRGGSSPFEGQRLSDATCNMLRRTCKEVLDTPNLRVTPGRLIGQRARPPGPRAAPPAAWRAVENRAALHRVGPHETRPSGPAPAAPRARRRRNRPGPRWSRFHPVGAPPESERCAGSRPGCGEAATGSCSAEVGRRMGDTASLLVIRPGSGSDPMVGAVRPRVSAEGEG